MVAKNEDYMIHLLSNMKNILKKIPSTGTLIIGDLIVDRYIWGNVNRISPEAPVPVVEVSRENILLGGAANVANNIVSLGGNVFITGIIGYDAMGSVLKDCFSEKRIDTEGIFEEKNRNTTLKTRIYAHDQQVVRFDRETTSNISKSSQSKILEYVRSCLNKINAIIISDYSKGVVTKNLIKKLIDLTGSRVFIAVDPKIGHFDYYKGTSLITPNTYEASFASGIKIADDITLKKAGEKILKEYNLKGVLITRGEKGMALFEKGGRTTNIPTLAKEVYDVTGAGDTVISVFTLCHSAGSKFKEAAEIANHAAGIVVGKRGNAVITRKDIDASIRMNKNSRINIG
jgi:D-beta-D-heptose 7-phosphate kinase/D-beta-D-heptose 1-phosphate adenosyltransferase